jgi:phage terminase large subunit-like protein
MCPGIVGNPYLGGHFPHPKQFHFLQQSLEKAMVLEPDEVYEALYGGAAGSAKSEAVLMAAAQQAFLYPGSATAILRRTMQELTKPGALLNRAIKRWSGLPGVNYNGSQHIFTFPNGSEVQFGYHHHPTHDAQYQGGEYHLVIFDELTYFPNNEAWLHLRSRMRRPQTLDPADKFPLRLLATSNPGGPGHAWVKNRFVGGTDPVSGEVIVPQYDFYPAHLRDNPSVDFQAYVNTLMHLHPARRKQLLDGDWDARDPGDYFRAEWFGPLLDPEKDKWTAGQCVRVRSWDLAASEAESASETAGVLMARSIRGARVVEDCVSFRLTPGARDARIMQVAKMDGPTVVQHFEVEPGSGGIAQVLNLEERIKRHVGCRVSYARPKVDQTDREAQRVHANPEHAKGKTGRAEPVSACLYRGHVLRGESADTSEPGFGKDRAKGSADQTDGIRLFAGPWTTAYLQDMESFPLTLEGNSTKIVRADKTDATSGAWAYLEAHPPGGSVAPRIKAEELAGELHDVHPEQRPERRVGGKTKTGHWKP